ncbi:MAG: DMT family transporter [Proteobacteria bacterium]|nr:DMT family transporter [Pseudomonadota bacterium]
MVIAAWSPPAMLALLLWGVSTFLPKVAVRTLSPFHMVVYSSGFFLCGATAVVVSRGFHVSFDPKGVLLGISVGILGTIGQTLYLFAIRHAKMTGVTAVSALYPVVATVLAFFILDEGLTWRQTAGIILGICALVLTTMANDHKTKQ